jgi:hypothetical protein
MGTPYRALIDRIDADGGSVFSLYRKTEKSQYRSEIFLFGLMRGGKAPTAARCLHPCVASAPIDSGAAPKTGKQPREIYEE